MQPSRKPRTAPTANQVPDRRHAPEAEARGDPRFDRGRHLQHGRSLQDVGERVETPLPVGQDVDARFRPADVVDDPGPARLAVAEREHVLEAARHPPREPIMRALEERDRPGGDLVRGAADDH